MRLLLRVLLIAAALLNAADAVLHVAIDQAEPLRIADNLVVIAGTVGMLGAVLIAVTTILLVVIAILTRRPNG